MKIPKATVTAVLYKSNFLHWMPGDHTRLAGKMQFHYRLDRKSVV